MFGALRFGMRSLVETVTPTGDSVPWIRLSGLALAIAWLSVHQGAAYLETTAVDATAACLVKLARQPSLRLISWYEEGARTERNELTGSGS